MHMFKASGHSHWVYHAKKSVKVSCAPAAVWVVRLGVCAGLRQGHCRGGAASAGACARATGGASRGRGASRRERPGRRGQRGAPGGRAGRGHPRRAHQAPVRTCAKSCSIKDVSQLASLGRGCVGTVMWVDRCSGQSLQMWIRGWITLMQGSVYLGSSVCNR